VSVDGIARPLPEPFLVVATQNRSSTKATYPLRKRSWTFHRQARRGYPTHRRRGGDAPPRAPRSRACDSRRRASGSRHRIAARRCAISSTPRTLPNRSSASSSRSAPDPRASERRNSVRARGPGTTCWRRPRRRPVAGREFRDPRRCRRVAPAVLRHRHHLRPEAELEHYRQTIDSAAIASVRRGDARARPRAAGMRCRNTAGATATTSSGITNSRPASRAAALAPPTGVPRPAGSAPSATLGSSRVGARARLRSRRSVRNVRGVDEIAQREQLIRCRDPLHVGESRRRDSACARRSIASSSAVVGYPTSSLAMKRSSCASGSGYVPSYSIDSASPRRERAPATPARCRRHSPGAPASLEQRGLRLRGVRLISSASTRFVKIGPGGTPARLHAASLCGEVGGQHVGVNCTRRKSTPIARANAFATQCLGTPGTPRAVRGHPTRVPASNTSTTWSWPTTTLRTSLTTRSRQVLHWVFPSCR